MVLVEKRTFDMVIIAKPCTVFLFNLVVVRELSKSVDMRLMMSNIESLF